MMSSHPTFIFLFHILLHLTRANQLANLQSCMRLESNNPNSGTLFFFREKEILRQFWTRTGLCRDIVHTDSLSVNGVCNNVDVHRHNARELRVCTVAFTQGTPDFRRCVWRKDNTLSAARVESQNMRVGSQAVIVFYDIKGCKGQELQRGRLEVKQGSGNPIPKSPLPTPLPSISKRPRKRTPTPSPKPSRRRRNPSPSPSRKPRKPSPLPSRKPKASPTPSQKRKPTRTPSPPKRVRRKKSTKISDCLLVSTRSRKPTRTVQIKIYRDGIVLPDVYATPRGFCAPVVQAQSLRIAGTCTNLRYYIGGVRTQKECTRRYGRTKRWGLFRRCVFRKRNVVFSQLAKSINPLRRGQLEYVEIFGRKNCEQVLIHGQVNIV